MSLHEPSFDTSDWTDEVVKEYLTATSQQKDDPEKFYDTHLDIDEIYAEFLGDTHQDASVTQEDVRDEILSEPPKGEIRSYVLRGETGSGKSQLCQWLDYELQGLGEADNVEDRVPLHIKASETSLEQIISTLAEPLDVDPEVDQVTELDATDLAEGIIASIQANPGPKLKDIDLSAILDPQRGDLRSVLKSNIEDYQDGLREGNESDFDPNLISRDDYRELRLKIGTDSIFHENADVLRQGLRDEIHRHFSHLVGVDDFQGQLRDYTNRIVEEQERRPVIICEDVTTFSVLKEQLLDQIIQVESGTFDVVLGYTTGFEQDDLPDALGSRGDEEPLTYLKDRLAGYLSLTDNGEAYFLNDAISVELVRKYLHVIKRESGNGPSLDDGFDGLYPFNKAFIRRVYQSLQEEGAPRQTPRVLLQKVIRRCLLADEPPYDVVEKSTNVAEIVPTVDPTRYDDEVERVATWYGVEDSSSDKIKLRTAIPEAFGIELPDADTEQRDGETYVLLEPNSMAKHILGEVSNPQSEEPSTSPSSTTTEPDDSEPDESEDDSDTPQDESETGDTDTQTSSRKEQQMREFLDWAKTGDDYESSQKLRTGAEDLLEMWYDPTRLANPNASTRGNEGIYYTRGQSVPVSIQGPDERDGLDITIPFGEEYVELYSQILAYNLNDGFGDESKVGRLHAWATDEVVGFRTQMRTEIEQCLPEEMTIEHCLVLAKYLLLNAELGRTEYDRGGLFTEIDLDDREYDNPIREALGRNHGLSEALTDLWQRRSDIDGLVEGFFLLKNNLVDHDRLRPVRTDVAEDPSEYLQFAQQIDTERLEYPSAFNIGTTRNNANVRVTKFLDAISDYAVELEMLGDEDLVEYFEEHLQPVERWYDSGHTVAELTDLFERLEECLGTFEVAKEPNWGDVEDLLDDDHPDLQLSEFETVVEDFLDPNPDSPFERVAIFHSFAQSKENHHAWDVYKAIDEMVEALDTHDVKRSTDFDDRVSDLDAMNDYQARRDEVRAALEEYQP